MYKFTGKWITNKDFYSLKYIKKPSQDICSDLLQNQHILFRDKFHFDNQGKVYLYYSADDYAYIYINGHFVSMGPAISYPFHQYYNKVDITDYLIKGENSIAIHSYYQGMINRAYYSGDLRHGVIFDIVCGDSVLSSSNEKVKTFLHSGYSISHIAGWISENDFNYNTDYIENYDSNSSEDKFYLKDFDDSKWENSYIRINVDYKLKKTNIKPFKFENITPKEISPSVFDLKQEIVGYPFIKIKGQKGQVISVLCGEELNDDGSVRYIERCNCRYIEKWTLSGDEDIFFPYHYKAFRYIQLVSETPFVLCEIKGIARHYPFKNKTKFITDDKDLKKIYKLCINTIKYGVQDSFLDCPSREKGQYFGDGVYSSLTHVYLTGDKKLYQKFITDAFSSMKIDKCMTANGPCSYYQAIAEFPLFIVISLEYYLKMTNDFVFIKRQKKNVQKLLTNYADKYLDKQLHLIEVYDRWNVVDWPMSARDGYDFNLPQHERTNGFHNVMNAYFILALKAAINLYNDSFDIDIKSIEKAYIDSFYLQNSHEFRDSLNSNHVSLPSMIMGNLLHLVDNVEVKNNLIKMIKEKRLKASNLFMTPLMFLFLKESNEKALLLDLIKDKDGWLNMIKEGATTTFEAFSKDKKWNTSLLHTMFSFVVLFLR